MPRPLPPDSVVRPTPPDIHIAQACVPLPIATVAEELGLTPADYDLHGNTKAKARLRFVIPSFPSSDIVCAVKAAPAPHLG